MTAGAKTVAVAASLAIGTVVAWKAWRIYRGYDPMFWVGYPVIQGSVMPVYNTPDVYNPRID